MQQLEAIVLSEHQKLSNENPLLKQQIASLEDLNKLYVISDSLQKIEIQDYQEKVVSDAKKIKKLESSQNKTKVTYSVAGILLFILGLLL